MEESPATTLTRRDVLTTLGAGVMSVGALAEPATATHYPLHDVVFHGCHRVEIIFDWTPEKPISVRITTTDSDRYTVTITEDDLTSYPTKYDGRPVFEYSKQGRGKIEYVSRRGYWLYANPNRCATAR